MAFSPDGRRIISGSGDNTLKLWDSESGQELASLTGHSGRVRAVAFRPDGRWIVSGSGDRTLKLWDSESGQELASLIGHFGWVRAVAFSPDGRRIVSGSDDQTLLVWDTETQQIVARFAAESTIHDVAVSGQTIAAGDALGNVHFLTLENDS
ncbi:MAG: WD40 repeat domain-containing protein [Planctomycetota bacterium]